MTRNDLFLITILLIISLTPLIFDFGSEKKFAMIKIDGSVVKKIDLKSEEIFLIEAGGGKNIIEMKNGTIQVREADCPDKICMKRGAIKNVGEVIACVPHNLLIEIVND